MMKMRFIAAFAVALLCSPAIGQSQFPAHTVWGNPSASTGLPIAMSTTQLTALCNQFTTSLAGCVAASGGGTANFLRADGTWAAPSGGVAGSIAVGSTSVTGGTSLRVLYDNAGALGENTNAQLTALINPATAALSGALPAWPNNTTTFFRGDGTYAALPGSFSGFANPTATIGLTAVNGSAATAMRSDAAPAISQAIIPTWTGIHKWTADAYFGSGRPWVDARSTANGSCPAALGNGSNDDQPALQCQANYLNSTFVGGTLYLSNGNYHLGSTLTIPNGVNLVCESNTSTAIGVGGSSDLTAITFVNSAVNAFIRNCVISGDTNAAATQNLVVIPTWADVSIYDSLLVGGKFALEENGSDGLIFNTSIQGFGSAGGGVLSTGANWYVRVKIDNGTATAVGFKQGTSAPTQENHFIHTDISGPYTNSIVIDDGGNHTAITTFQGSVFSAPIVITSAKSTMFGGNEFGSATLTYNDGSLSVVNSIGLVSITVGGSATNYNCAGNISITCGAKNGLPNGSSGQVQYNNSGAFGGIAGVTTNGTSLTIASGDLILSGSGSGSSTLNAPATGGGTATLFAGSDTILGAASIATLTNKTFDTAGTGNSFKINGTAITAVTGSGSVVLATSPTTTVAGQTCTLGSTCGLSSINNSLVAPVNLTNTGYTDGPSVAQGGTGTWFASGNVTVTGTSNDYITCRLWDGTTLIDSQGLNIVGSSLSLGMHLSGILASPAGNLRISCENTTAARGTMAPTNGIDAKASTLTAFRIN